MTHAAKNSRAIATVVLIAGLCTTACSNAASNNDGLGSSRVWVKGTVVRLGTGQPVNNTLVTFVVPIESGVCSAVNPGMVYSNPPEVKTDSLGRFGAEVTAFGFPEGNRCILVTAMTVTLQRPGVRFRLLGDPRIDTLSLQIAVP